MGKLAPIDKPIITAGFYRSITDEEEEGTLLPIMCEIRVSWYKPRKSHKYQNRTYTVKGKAAVEAINILSSFCRLDSGDAVDRLYTPVDLEAAEELFKIFTDFLAGIKLAETSTHGSFIGGRQRTSESDIMDYYTTKFKDGKKLQ